MGIRLVMRQAVAGFLSGVLALQPLAVLAQSDLQDPAAAGRIAVQMQRSLTAIEDGLTLMDRSHWDPQAVVDTLGPDPEGLRMWLRSNVIWVPYAGALRGAAGVLSDRRANTLDGAILMATLLSTAGYQVRIQQATLSDAAVDAVITQPAVTPPEPVGAEVGDNPLTATEQMYELEPGSASGALASPIDEAMIQKARIALSVLAPAEAIRANLTAPDPAADSAASDAAVRAGLAQHFWAEYLNGPTWTAADWLTADGQPPAGATSQASFAPDAIPDDLLQRVTLALVEEWVKDGHAQTATIAQFPLVPARGEGRKINLIHQPMAWPADWPTVTEKDVQDKLRSAFATQSEWRPVLSIDGAPQPGPSVRADGSLNDDPQPNNDPFIGVGVKLGGQVIAAGDTLNFDGSGADTSLPQGLDAQTGEWTAEWLSFTIEAPGAAPRTELRPIFDLIGPAARAAGQQGAFKISDQTRGLRSLRAMSEIEIGILPAAPSADQILFEGAQAVLANKPILDQIAADPFGKVPANIVELMGQMQPIPGAIESFAALRMMANPVGEAVYQDRPLIVARHNYYVRDSQSGDFQAISAMDIVDAGVGVMPYAGLDPRYARILQGLTDAEAESASLQGSDLAFGAGTLLTGGPQEDWVMLAQGDSVADLPHDLAAAVAGALGAGRLALVPRGELAATGLWWDIDPATGETLAMGPDGWGQSLVEYAFILVMKTLWAQIGCLARTAAMNTANQAFLTGKLTLPKTVKELKTGTKNIVRQCISTALVNSITGMTTAVFVGLPGYVQQSWLTAQYGPNYGSAAPNTLLPPPPAPYVNRSDNKCPPGLPGSCAINTSNSPYRDNNSTTPFTPFTPPIDPSGKQPPGANPYSKTRVDNRPGNTQPGINPTQQMFPPGNTQPGTQPMVPPGVSPTQPMTVPPGNTQPMTPQGNTQPGTQPMTVPRGQTQPQAPLGMPQPGVSPTQPMTVPPGNTQPMTPPVGPTPSPTPTPVPRNVTNTLTPDQLQPALRTAYDNAVNGLNAYQRADDAYNANPNPATSAAREQAAINAGLVEQRYVAAKIRAGVTNSTSNTYPNPADDPIVAGHQGIPPEPPPSTLPEHPAPIGPPPMPGGANGGFAQTLSGLGGLQNGLGATVPPL